jgi:predicted phosphodiesterase
VGGIAGNLPALEAVLEHIDSAGIHTILNTGNSLVGLVWPNEVMDRITGRGVVTVQGEWDRWVARFERAGKAWSKHMDAGAIRSIEWAHRALSPERIETVNGWPKQRMLTLDGIALCLCHGAPSGQGVSLDKNTPEMRFRRERELANARIIVCGRTPRAFARWVDDTLFVNPGSVGVPAGKAAVAVYTTISTEEEPWSVRVHRVRYDGDAVRRRLREAGLDYPDF